MKILILGGTGVISTAIVRQGLAAGHEIVTFNRGSKQSAYADRITELHGDRRDRADFAAKMAAVQADVVIDMISFNAEDAAQTVEVFGGRNDIGQIIFTSSIAAYARPYRSFPIREEAETLNTDPAFPYSFYKAEMERYLQTVIAAGGTPITIIRPSLTFGVGAANLGVLRQNYNIVDRLRRHKPLVLFGEGTVSWSFTFVDDLARAYIACCGNEKTYGEAFHITNNEVVLWEDLYRTVADIVGEKPEFVYIPTALLREADFDLFAHFYYEKKYPSVFSNEKFNRVAPDWKPEISLRAGMEEIVAWWEREANRVDPEKDRLEDELCRCYEAFAASLRALKH